MPKRIVVQTVLLNRKGESIRPTIGKPFDFTDDELKQINALNPDALAKIINQENPGEEMITLTQAELDERVRADQEKMRKEMEAELRKEIEAEIQAKNAPVNPDDSKNKAPAKGGKKAEGAGSEDDI